MELGSGFTEEKVYCLLICSFILKASRAVHCSVPRRMPRGGINDVANRVLPLKDLTWKAKETDSRLAPSQCPLPQSGLSLGRVSFLGCRFAGQQVKASAGGRRSRGERTVLFCESGRALGSLCVALQHHSEIKLPQILSSRVGEEEGRRGTAPCLRMHLRNGMRYLCSYLTDYNLIPGPHLAARGAGKYGRSAPK